MFSGILDCNKLQSFWISWKEGLVQLGQGNQIGSKVVLQGRLPRINARYLGITTVGPDNKGLWEFRHIKGSACYVTSINIKDSNKM